MNIGGIAFTVASPEAAVNKVLSCVEAGEPVAFHFANAYSVSIAESDPDYRAATSRGVVYPDGAPVALAMRLRGSSGARQVRGPTLFRAVLASRRSVGRRHYFLGSSPTTLDRLAEAIRCDYQGVVVEGVYSPPYAPVDDDFVRDCVQAARNTQPDVIWLGLGTPKQDLLAHRLASELGCPVLAVGAAFDYVAGTVSEAPQFVRGTGFEWLYRLAVEPRRLWRRYTVGSAIFVRAALAGALDARRRHS